MLKLAFKIFPFYNLMSSWTSGYLLGFGCLTQWAKVSSKSKMIVFLRGNLVKGTSTILDRTSSSVYISKFYKKLIDWKMWIVNSLNTGPFNS